jgi:hypothetical protein
MRHSEQSNAMLSAHTPHHTTPHTTTTTILSIDSNSQQYKCFNVIHLFRYPCQRERESNAFDQLTGVRIMMCEPLSVSTMPLISPIFMLYTASSNAIQPTRE